MLTYGVIRWSSFSGKSWPIVVFASIPGFCPCHARAFIARGSRTPKICPCRKHRILPFSFPPPPSGLLGQDHRSWPSVQEFSCEVGLDINLDQITTTNSALAPQPFSGAKSCRNIMCRRRIHSAPIPQPDGNVAHFFCRLVAEINTSVA